MLSQNLANGTLRNNLETFTQTHSLELSSFLKGQDPFDVINQSLQQIPATNQMAQTLLLERFGIINDNKTGTKKYTGVIKEVVGEAENRKDDAAILHLLLYPPRFLDLQDREYLVETLKRHLMADSGFVRYKEDWFHHGGGMLVENASKLPIDPNTHIPIWDESKNAYVTSSEADRKDIFDEYYRQKYNKDMTAVIKKTGPDLEMQWSFQDPMLVQIYTQLYRETNQKKFLEQAWFHLGRSMAQISGERQMSIEGQLIKAFQALEAWVPFRLIMDGRTETAYFASPNSPLNWTIAELANALDVFMAALKHAESGH